MKYLLLIPIFFLSFLTGYLLLKYSSNNINVRVLGASTLASDDGNMLISYPTETPTPTPTPTSTPLPTSTPKPSPTPTPSPTPIPQPQYSQEQVHGFVERFARQYAIDPNILRHIAVCESGFNPSAINGPYQGLYQFGTSAWTNLRVEMGEDTSLSLRTDAEEASQTAAYALSQGKGGLWPNCLP